MTTREEKSQLFFNELGLGSKEERMQADLWGQSFAMALLARLVALRILPKTEIPAIFRLADKLAEKQAALALAALDVGLWIQGLKELSPEEVKQAVKAILVNGAWFQDNHLVRPGKEQELARILTTARDALTALEAEEDGGQ
jgi:hypothetical protein